MAISTADFRNGMCIEYNNKLCTIVEFQHVKPGKGGAFVRTKLRDIKTGRVVDYTFNAGTKFDSVRLETKKMQFLYSDGTDFNFMDMSSFEQLSIPAETVGSAANWLKENDALGIRDSGEFALTNDFFVGGNHSRRPAEPLGNSYAYRRYAPDLT